MAIVDYEMVKNDVEKVFYGLKGGGNIVFYVI